MVLEPRLLVADEPVSSLDASVRGEILQLMLGLVRDTGVAILVVTHDLGLAWNIANRVAVMYLGRIVEQGTTEELLDDPRHPYTRALLSVVPEKQQARAADPHGRGARPDAHPGRLPVPSALSRSSQSGEAERLGIDARCQRRGSGRPACRARRRGRLGARRGLSRRRLTGARVPGPYASRRGIVRSKRRSCRTPAVSISLPSSSATTSMTTWYASASERRSSRASVRTSASGQAIR